MKSFYFAVSIVLCFIGIMYMCRNMKVNHEAQINGDLERINTDKYKFEVDLDKSIANLSVKEDYNPEAPIESEYQYYVDGIQMPDVFNSPESMSDAVRSLQEYIKKDAETDYDLESYAADGIGTENIDDLMKIFLSDRKRQRITITDSGEWKNYSADFNASYGWESVLVKMFKILGVYLANGSQLDISIDNDYNGLVIRNGICKQINLKGEEEKSL